MSPIEKMLYQNQKLTVLKLKLDNDVITDAYAYAWYRNVYPLFSEGAEWHVPYESFFEVTADMLDELSEYLDSVWETDNVPSFYDLEDKYITTSSKWSRSTLISACKYMYLDGAFNDQLWNKVCENMKCPSEAHSIKRPFNKTDMYFN